MELAALQSQGVDDMTYDAASKRLYARGDGTQDVYQQTDPDSYSSLER